MGGSKKERGRKERKGPPPLTQIPRFSLDKLQNDYALQSLLAKHNDHKTGERIDIGCLS